MQDGMAVDFTKANELHWRRAFGFPDVGEMPLDDGGVDVAGLSVELTALVISRIPKLL